MSNVNFMNQDTAAQPLSGKRERLIELLRSRQRERKQYPLSSAQYRLWFLSQLNPTSTAYHMVSSVTLRGDINMAALEQAFQEIVRRHEILRTHFIVENDHPSQVIHDRPLRLEITDLKGIPDVDASQLAAELGQEDSERLFDLSQGPLLRIRMFWISRYHYGVVLTLHHIISDGLSQQILLSEMSDLYEQFSSGRPSRLPELNLEYGRYAQWQQEWIESDTCKRQLEDWTARLRDLQTLDLPTDRPRPMFPNYSGATEVLALGRELFPKLHELRKAESASFYMLLLAAYAVLLSRYSGQSEFAVGTTVANRSRQETEPMIGLFANTLALPLKVDEQLTYRQLVRTVKNICLDAYDKQEIPFDRLIEVIEPQRDLSRNPIFQVAFLLLETESFSARIGQAEFGQLSLHNRTSKFDWTLEIHQYEDTFEARLEYSADLFNQGTIRRTLEHFQQLTEELISAPDKAIWRIELKADHPLCQFSKEVEKDQPFGKQLSMVPEMIAWQASLHPDAIAVSAADEQCTYEHLDHCSNALANLLQQRGIGPESIVAVNMDRSIELVVALLGIWKAGAAYLPLDSGQPLHRVQDILAASHADAMLVHLEQDYSSLANSVPAIIAVDVTGLKPIVAPVVIPEPHQLAYVIYTSGTTGSPKGVMIEHGAIANHMHWMQREFPLSPDDAVLQKTSIGFDASVWEFWAPLVAGARLIMAEPGREKDGSYLVDAIRRHSVSTLQVVPMQLEMVMERGIGDCDSLRRVFCGGGVLTKDVAHRFGCTSKAKLVNLYGPTEATIDATFWPNSETDVGTQSIPIGQAILNTRVYLLDSMLRHVPSRSLGELWIAGDGLGRGYLGASDLTAGSFLPDPYDDRPGQRMYRTGDICRYVRPSVLEFYGRRDLQVKVRGYRIELGEIENLLRRHPRVRSCAVTLKGNSSGSGILVAYIVPSSSEPLDQNDLQSFSRAHLPEYMVPVHWISLEHLPQTRSGKLDRRNLPDLPSNSTASTFTQGGGAQTEEEGRVMKVWLDVLDIPEIGRDDNFFDVGGDSLKLTILSSRLARELNREIPVVSLFQYPTVASFTASLKERPERNGVEPANLAEKIDVGQQRRLQRLAVMQTQ